MKLLKRAIAFSACAVVLLACGESAEPSIEGRVDFTSDGAAAVRDRACAQDFELAARKGAAKETYNSSILWSVSPYKILVPSTGTGHVRLNVDAPHYDWLIYTTAEIDVVASDGRELVYRGPVEECPELNLFEYGVHHPELTEWPMILEGEPQSHVLFYAGLAATDHSDPEEAGHAGHDLTGDEDAPDHGGH